MFLTELELLDPLLHLFDVVAFFLFSELLLDRLKLLAQKHFALSLAQLRLDLRLNVFLCIDPRELPLHRQETGAHALFIVE